MLDASVCFGACVRTGIRCVATAVAADVMAQIKRGHALGKIYTQLTLLPAGLKNTTISFGKNRAGGLTRFGGGNSTETSLLRYTTRMFCHVNVGCRMCAIVSLFNSMPTCKERPLPRWIA